MGIGNSKINVEEKAHVERIAMQRLTFGKLLFQKNFPGFERADTNEARVAIMCKRLMNDNLILYNNTCTERVKTSKISSAYREKGNAAYLSKPQNIELALLCYTKAIATAPFPTSEKPYATELALAFGNRSAVMLARKQYEECLRDIGQALKYHDPDNHKVKAKLWRRGRDCLHFVGNLADDAKCFQETGTSSLVSSQDIEKDLIPILEQLSKIAIGEHGPEVINQPERVRCPPPQLADGPNPQVPALSSCVEVAYDPKYGRLIRATRDIEPGEVLLFEKPYVLNPTPDLQHCDNCSKPSHALIPCKTCHVVMFCSESCLDESWQQSHELECPVLLSLVDYAESRMSKALRTLMTALTRYNGIRGLFDYIQQLEANTAADGRIRGFNDEGKYLSSDYSTVHFLADHTKRQTKEILIVSALIAAGILIHIDRHGNASLKQELRDVKMKKFVGGLLMKYLLSDQVNASAIFGYEYADRNAVLIGSATFPVASMMNHACCTNTYELFYGMMSFSTSCRRIAKGEMVTSSYILDKVIENSSTRERKLFLQMNYLFGCECRLCTQVWPHHCREQPMYRTCLKCRAPLPGSGLSVADTNCLRCKATNRRMDLEAAESKIMTDLLSLLSRADNGEDVKSKVHSLIAEFERMELPQKGFVGFCKRILYVVSITTFCCTFEEPGSSAR